MKKRPKLFYTPGMISLLVLPVLFYMYQPAEKKQNVLKLTIPQEDQPEEPSPFIMRFSRAAVMAELRGKKINTVYYDEDHSLNARKLEFIEHEALKLKFYHDTTQVIKVHLSADNTYGELVQLINAMYKNKQKIYALLDNDFYIFGEYPPIPDTDTIPYFTCGGGYMQVTTTPIETFWEQVNKFKSYIVNNALLLSAFVLLIAVPVIIKRKRGY